MKSLKKLIKIEGVWCNIKLNNVLHVLNTELKRTPKTVAPTLFRSIRQLQRGKKAELEHSLPHLNCKHSKENSIAIKKVLGPHDFTLWVETVKDFLHFKPKKLYAN